MKKSIFKFLVPFAILAVVALNVTVVTSDMSHSSLLKWEMIGKILAGDDDSGSGSSAEEELVDGPKANCTCTKKVTISVIPLAFSWEPGTKTKCNDSNNKVESCTESSCI